MIEIATWSAGGRSVRGARHERAGQPNQDALAIAPDGPVLAAVADGHGSARHPRSDVGASIAVAVATSVLPAFVHDPRDLATVRNALAERLVAAWRVHVAAHLAAHPLVVADIDTDPDLAGDDAGGYGSQQAYGATLVAVVAQADEVLAVQIGDGDAWLTENGSPRRLIAHDLRYVFNGTASLCQPNAEREVRVARVTVERPALAIVATDGYARTLPTEADVGSSLRGLYERVRTLGLDAVVGALPVDLAGASAHGGDDVTVGMVYRA